MMLRWHRYRNSVTAVQVRDYASLHECSMADALKALRRETPWILQGFDENERRWYSIMHVEEPHPPE